jgi:hypothetical protein
MRKEQGPEFPLQPLFIGHYQWVATGTLEVTMKAQQDRPWRITHVDHERRLVTFNWDTRKVDYFAENSKR